jgi:hypothetical protein
MESTIDEILRRNELGFLMYNTAVGFRLTTYKRTMYKHLYNALAEVNKTLFNLQLLFAKIL